MSRKPPCLDAGRRNAASRGQIGAQVTQLRHSAHAGLDMVTKRERFASARRRSRSDRGQGVRSSDPPAFRWCYVLVTARVGLVCLGVGNLPYYVHSGYASSNTPSTTTSLDPGASQGHDASGFTHPKRLLSRPLAPSDPAHYSTPRRFSDDSSTPARARSIAKPLTFRGSAYLIPVAITKT